MKSSYQIINIGALVAMIVVVVNMFTLRELWLLYSALAVMIILIVYALKEKRNLKSKLNYETRT